CVYLCVSHCLYSLTALGTQPSVSMDSTQGEQTQLVCRSEGWDPEPEVIWRDRDGNDVTSLSNTTMQRDSQGLRSVSSYIKINQQSNVFSCLLRSKIPKPDWESKLHIARDFFPGVSGWMVAFFLTLALSIGAIPLLVIQWKRMDASHMNKFLVGFLSNESIVLEIVQQGKTLLKEQNKTDIQKQNHKHNNKINTSGQAGQIAFTDRRLFISVDVTLDPDTAHPWVNLSVEGKRMRRRETRQDVPNTPVRFDDRLCVLGKEGFTSGRHYWQVQVGENTRWALGVSRESAPRKGGFSMTPQQGYWTVERVSGDEFIALTDPKTPLPRSLKPQKLGVYLDYEEEQLSFYNVETRSHIFTFTDIENPNEKLYPFFWTLEYKDLVLESPDPDPVSAAD
ncbi:BT1A1 protein, partial [Polyodon spathula]|nr:BT1A1 protein [Polyodon spathula]